MNCLACSSPNPETSRFCSDCGEPLIVPSGEATRDLPPDYTPRAADALHRRFSPGAILASRYRIIEQVGSGGMGEVYHADDLTLSQPVALKFLPEGLSRDSQALERFLGEVRITRQISHPNVCRVYDIGESEGLYFLSMEYIRGEDLRSLLRRIGRLPVDKALEIAGQLTSGLAAAHEKGVLHRDLKPANVMLDERGQARITDFGLAAAVGAVEAQDISSGTLAYMAPEQREGREVTERSDIYSLGLVLYEVFTGHRAFEDAEPQELRAPSSLVSGLDATVERLILQCLSERPEDRPASAAALRAALPSPDQLAVALARGETPAPALVAEAGEYAGVSPGIAWACLVVVILALAGNVVLVNQTRIMGIVPLPKSPELLLADAQGILETLGYPTPQRDSTYGFVSDRAYIDELVKGHLSSDWWDLLRRGDPGVVRFWYRESPRYLVPHRITEFYPAEHDPPLTVPGMVSLQLDTEGHLRQLEAAPPRHDVEKPGAIRIDWAPLLHATGFPTDSLTRVEPVWLPPSYADQRAAWEGVYPEAPEVSVRLEAAAYQGRAVAFRVVEPWSEPSASTDSGWTSASDVVPSRVERIVHVGLNLLLIVVLALLARRNVKLGRGDRKLAYRLASILAGLMMLEWLLAAHHVPESVLQLFYGGLYRATFVFGLAALLYLAIEPYARKLWPRSLASWVRLLSGRVRDPIVGRDVLIGCTWAFLFGLLNGSLRLAPLWFGGIPPRPDLPTHPAQLLALRGLEETVAQLVSTLVNSATHVLYLVVALVLLRFVFRKTWIAVPIHWALYVFVYGTAFGYIPIALTFVVWHFVFFRFGIVPIVVSTVLANVLMGFPLTTDFSAWQAYISYLACGFCLAIAVYGFKVSLAGRPAFKDLLAES